MVALLTFQRNYWGICCHKHSQKPQRYTLSGLSFQLRKKHRENGTVEEALTRSVPQTQKITLREKADTGRKLGVESNAVDAVTDQTGLHRKRVVESLARGSLSIRHKGQGWPVCGGTHLKSQHLGGGDGKTRSHPPSYTANSRSSGNPASGQRGSPKKNQLSPGQLRPRIKQHTVSWTKVCASWPGPYYVLSRALLCASHLPASPFPFRSF